MSGEFEAIGDAMTGAVAGRALEPRAGEPVGQAGEGTCLNCGAALSGPYCNQCGQQARVHRTLGAFFHDLLHGLLHFEGKIWRTLPLLIWRPGKLTREYIDGRRASYVSPIALFLFVVFLTFATFQLFGSAIHLGPDLFGGTVIVDGRRLPTMQAEREIAERIAGLERQQQAAAAAGKPTASLESQIAENRTALAAMRAVAKGDIAGAAMGQDGDAKLTVSTPLGTIDNLWQKARKNPDLLLYKLQANTYKFSWLLIPVSVPFLWLLFPFSRRFRLYDHTVFVTYSLAFMMLALIVASIGANLDFAPLVIVPVLYAPFHMYRQLRETYETGGLGAIVRTMVLLGFAAVALTLWLLAIFTLILGA